MAGRKTAPPWRRVFLRELARGGSVALAAAKCGIDRSSAYQARKRNAAFAASWERALETARERLAQGPLHHPADGRSPRAGEEPLHHPLRGRSPSPSKLEEDRPVLRGDEVIRSSKTGRVCIVRAGPGRWSARVERAFLEELTATANVKAAARAAGVSAVAAYNRRKLWPDFAAKWDEAKAEGYVRLEMLLIHAATATLDPEPSAAEAREAPAMTVEQAMNLHKLHRASQQGGGAHVRPQRYGWRRREPDIEEVRAEILRKVAAMARARGLKGRG